MTDRTGGLVEAKRRGWKKQFRQDRRETIIGWSRNGALIDAAYTLSGEFLNAVLHVKGKRKFTDNHLRFRWWLR